MRASEQIIMIGGSTALGGGGSGPISTGFTPKYFVSPTGSDSNDGLSASTPWLTVAKVNGSSFSPGDVIAFKGGGTWAEKLVVPSSGTIGNPVVFTAYGNYPLPIFRPTGSNNGVSGTNKSYVTIDHLTVIGSGQTTCVADGIYFENNQAGNTKLSGITIANCNVSRFGLNGVLVYGNNGTSGFNNVLISSVIAHDNAGAARPSSGGTCGIKVNSQAGYGSGLTAPAHTNVNITGCTAYNNIGRSGASGWTGSGIVIGETQTGYIQNCVAHDNGSVGYGAVAIWCYDSDTVIIQSNEAYGQLSTGSDGNGFDIDGGCKNCIMQYNFSHGNYGSGYLLYAYDDGGVTQWDNNTCRFNISVNDGRGFYIERYDTSTVMANVKVYGNTVYNDHTSCMLLNHIASGVVSNNIFYCSAAATPVIEGSDTSIILTGNDYYNPAGLSFNWGGSSYASYSAWQTATSQEEIGGVNVGFHADPLLASAGGLTAASYLLQATSPMIGAGLNLNAKYGIDQGALDYFGNTNVAAYSIGANHVYSAPVATFTALNPADKTGSAILLDGNLRLTSNGGQAAARSTAPIAVGQKIYLEVTLVAGGADELDAGIVDSAYNFAAAGGHQRLYWFLDAIYGDGGFSAALPGGAVGSILRIAIDRVNGKYWMALDGGNWNNSGTANPEANTNGFDIPVWPNVYVLLQGWGTSCVTLANFGASPWAYSAPSGFGALMDS